MKKYLFLAVFGLMFVPSLVSASNLDLTSLWKTLAGLLQQENQLLREEVVKLKEINQRLAQSNECPIISENPRKQELKSKIAELKLQQELVLTGQLDEKYQINHYTVTRQKVYRELNAQIAKLNLELINL